MTESREELLERLSTAENTAEVLLIKQKLELIDKYNP